MKRWWKWLKNCLTPKRTKRLEKLEIIGSHNKKRIARGVKRFFEKNYELRFNVMKQTEEFRPRKKQGRRKAPSILAKPPIYDPKPPIYDAKPLVYDAKPLVYKEENGWQQLTDRELRRIAFEQMEQVGVAWSIDVELYVRSALTPDYSPVLDFLSRCGTWDGRTDHIRALARRVPTDFPQWPDFFHRWFLAMVAQWMQLDDTYGNAIVPMLIGAQGTHKTTFCRNMLPPSLREYFIDDIKLDSAEQVERMLGRMMLVCIDEYNAKTEREQAKIKRILSEKQVQTRKMRSDQYLLLPRMASFIATTNDYQPLTDPTGSRRYLCCEVTGIIDTTTPIDYPQLYAQAQHELKAGQPYYFTKEEETIIGQHNTDYRLATSPEQLLTTWFMPAPRHKDYFMLATDIQATLARHVSATDLPNLKVLTMALKACRFHHGCMGGQRGWYAQPVSAR